MKAKVVQSFSDGKKKCIYTVGEIIELNKKRYEEINSTSNGTLVEEIIEENINANDEEENNKEE